MVRGDILHNGLHIPGEDQCFPDEQPAAVAFADIDFRQGAGIALLMSERRALRAATAELNRQIDAEEAELNRIARRRVSRHMVQTTRGVA
ncbi:hypothetical protein [Komagataeibacter diospyri]|uniref:hypothetical protein n=1 Tax=Komagataeibacter diospyri TaxID=1932662 RepID=UPI00350E48F0